MTQGNLSKLLARAVPRKFAKLKSLQRHVPRLSKSDRCLDIGTGHGGLSYYYCRQGSWTFMDWDSKNLSVAKDILEGDFIGGDALEVLNQLSQLSLITAVDVIFYLKNYADFLKLSYQAMKPGGFLIITGIEEDELSCLNRLRNRLGLTSAVGSVAQLNRSFLRKQMIEIGFEITDEELFCGPLTLALQTFLDVFSRDTKAQGDQLTQDLSRSKNHHFIKKLMGWMSLPLTQFTVAIDRLFFRKMGHGFLIKACRK